MAIVVNSPAERGDSASDIANLVMAFAVILVLLFGALYILPRLASRAAAPATPTNINVTLPANTPAQGTGAGNTGGSSGSANQ